MTKSRCFGTGYRRKAGSPAAWQEAGRRSLWHVDVWHEDVWHEDVWHEDVWHEDVWHEDVWHEDVWHVDVQRVNTKDDETHTTTFCPKKARDMGNGRSLVSAAVS